MDYRNRAEREAKLAAALARLGASQRRKLLEIMGDPPKIENVAPEYWDASLAEWRGVLTPELESIFVDSAMELVAAQPGLGMVDWEQVNQGAADWARRYSNDLIKKIDDTTMRGVQDAVADYYEQSWTVKQLTERLGRWFGPVRAEMIAVTEVTRAAVEGEMEVIKEVAEQGIQMTAIWSTANDDLTCDICRPLNQLPAEGGTVSDPTWTHPVTGQIVNKPPAHPRCRCAVDHELPKRKR